MSGAVVSVVCRVSCREELRSLERVRGGTSVELSVVESLSINIKRSEAPDQLVCFLGVRTHTVARKRDILVTGVGSPSLSRAADERIKVRGWRRMMATP